MKSKAFFEGGEVGGASGCHGWGQSRRQGLIQIYITVSTLQHLLSSGQGPGATLHRRGYVITTNDVFIIFSCGKSWVILAGFSVYVVR